ncbi:aldolase/citrate lyase family protein [Alphaproteobacteria bacterium]|jgi:2-dehydro-3-deoxyglucarate aldolase/4-hydroxy-2-oxoheptanedioate aldolase|nr:aldolase/citrate lyase family protein [Alphaproteobacteria bacterium]MDA9816547.1 aldolase/citrate lyase family protein [Alphaproteobacteria bacterium]MDA9914808.1 aldolase/citrate lyase family protein [Alphaproteobacteria bacterium]
MHLRNRVTSLDKLRGAMIFEFFSPGIPIILKNAGCEFIIFDMEHGGLSLEQFKVLATISNSNQISPLIRIPEVSYNYVARALDLGASGIMAPMVNTAEEAMKVVKSSKYPPEGIRGAGFGFAHDNYNNQNPLKYIKKANDELINIIQIETKYGLENVELIAAIDGVDCLWVGHFDLTNFLGIPGDFTSSIYLDAIKRVVDAGKINKKSLGIMVNNNDELEMYSELGFNMIAVGTEMNILSRSISQIIN